MQIKDIMVMGVATLDPDADVAEAAKLMRDQDVGMLVVGNEQSVEGVITDRDLLVGCVAAGHPSVGCRIAGHMSTPAITSSPETDTLEAAGLMREMRIKRLPIVQRGSLVGIVSFTDIAQSLEQPIHNVLFGSSTAHRARAATLVGQVTHYYTHLGVAALQLEEPIRQGDRIQVVGHSTNLEQEVESIEIDRKRVDIAYAGDDVAIKVNGRTRPGDAVYRKSD
ncbi:MAG: CBS domain-containing protein [Dehalococcoidia bacterium]|nr:CBS domain-containing protein [Dehalococcoidia bacterium]